MEKNKIEYRILDVPISNFDLPFGEELKWKSYLYISDLTIDEFLEYDPPCKECLVQATCLYTSTVIDNEYSKYIYLNLCDRLNDYIKIKGLFKKL
jgi:hypothetical protein